MNVAPFEHNGPKLKYIFYLSRRTCDSHLNKKDSHARLVANSFLYQTNITNYMTFPIIHRPPSKFVNDQIYQQQMEEAMDVIKKMKKMIVELNNIDSCYDIAKIIETAQVTAKQLLQQKQQCITEENIGTHMFPILVADDDDDDEENNDMDMNDEEKLNNVPPFSPLRRCPTPVPISICLEAKQLCQSIRHLHTSIIAEQWKLQQIQQDLQQRHTRASKKLLDYYQTFIQTKILPQKQKTMEQQQALLNHIIKHNTSSR